VRNLGICRQIKYWLLQAADFIESLTAKGFSFDGKSSTLVIGKQYTILANVLFEHCNFSLQILDSLLLLAIDPTGQND
jgi:hypothetical protein